MAPHQPDIIDATPQPRFWGLRFATAIEGHYQVHRAETNHRDVAITLSAATVLRNLSLIGDYLAARHYLFLFSIGRSLLVPPICVLLVVALWHKCQRYDETTVTFALGVTAAILKMTGGFFRYPYLFGIVLYMIMSCTVVRPRWTQYRAESL